MKTAFIVFDRMTTLDFVGVFDPLGRLKTMGFMSDFRWSIVARTRQVTDDRGLTILADAVEPSLHSFDLVVVPGGLGTRELKSDESCLEWLRTAKDVPIKASVCTGAVLLGAAGFLEQKTATTHPTAFDELAPYCHRVVSDRIVDEGDVVTSGGVTASIDLGLHLVERIAGGDARAGIARQMDYSQ